ncbi:extracellular solute-binding protein [Devosia sp. SL43]|uniref:extracellular solute-binding protein n=1 Tax=Devosia sp. SL43 TaxID=2806348 RepID=UPI001F267EC6|nr:extracellular solute-binding protein [Devosia sp. SL43]UJW87425.1 extracellular solute-binding protein [Devosia sp. SL43]
MFNRTLRRRTVLAGAMFAALAGVSSIALAQELSGELVILQWQTGTDGQMWKDIEAKFTELNPGVTIREFQPAGGQGDARGGMRTALLGGEVVDIIINTWPAFRAELVNSGILRPVDDQWASFGLDDKLSQAWRDLGSIDGTTYGVTYTYGDRSAIWYKTAQLEKAGITPPQTWEEFLASFEKLKAAGYPAPVVIPAKYWAHTEWFETLLLRTAGVEFAADLASHQVPWTDPKVKVALMKYGEMLQAGCCADAATMLATEEPYPTLYTSEESNYLLFGMWTNSALKNDLGLTEGVDYSIFQFPSLGMGFDDTASVDAKELNVTTNGANPAAADAFLDFIVGPEASTILATYGYASPSTAMDASLLGPVQQIATGAVATSKVQFVLGDLLPGDLVDEYRVQLQKFLQDPSEANVDTVLAAIEAKAATAY